MAYSQTLIKKIHSAPLKPGVYLFKDAKGKVLYVGKAALLRYRLGSYVSRSLPAKTEKFISQSRTLSWILVRSELEAILLEMNLIKQLKPPYNVTWRDDKRPLYLVVTKEEFPKIKTSRLPEPGADFFGPFPSSYKLRQILKSLRRVFHFCTCRKPRKPCIFADLGLCWPSPAQIVSKSEKARYRQNIRRLKLFLSGKIDNVVRELRKSMRQASFKQKFEEAAEIRDQIGAIEELLSNQAKISEYLTSRTLQPELPQVQLKALRMLLNLKKVGRIEGYDVANLGGKVATASLVVFEDGKPNPNQYRRFKVRLPDKPNDPAMLGHVVARRLGHRDWPLPDLILVDGGKGQVSRLQKVLLKAHKKIPVIGLAKREEMVVIPKKENYGSKSAWQTLTLPPEHPALNLLKTIRDEAHRFATSYHKWLRQRRHFNL